jgi:hypothetical protein
LAWGGVVSGGVGGCVLAHAATSKLLKTRSEGITTDTSASASASASAGTNTSTSARWGKCAWRRGGDSGVSTFPSTRPTNRNSGVSTFPSHPTKQQQQQQQQQQPNNKSDDDDDLSNHHQPQHWSIHVYIYASVFKHCCWWLLLQLLLIHLTE